MKLKKLAAWLLAASMTLTTWGMPVFADETVDASGGDTGAAEEVISEEAEGSAEDMNLNVTPVEQAIAEEAEDKADHEAMINEFCEAYLAEQAKEEEEGTLTLSSAYDDGVLADGDKIEESGTFTINSGSYGIVTFGENVSDVTINGEGFVIQTNDKTLVQPAQMSLYFKNPNGVKLTLNDVALTMSSDYDHPDSATNDPDRSVIRFAGGENVIELNGVNLIERNFENSYWGTMSAGIAINDPDFDGGDSLTFTTSDPDDRGLLYFYTRAPGTGIGGDNDMNSTTNFSDTGVDTVKSPNGTIVFDGPDVFAKSTKQGTMIGAPYAASTSSYGDPVPQGNIAIKSGSLNMITNSNSVLLGGSCASSADSLHAGMIFIEGGTLNFNMDWAGPVAKSVGSYRNADNDPLINGSAGAGYILYKGGSMRVYKDMNAAGKWTVGGAASKGYGIDFCGIGCNIKDNTAGDFSYNDTGIDPESVSELSNMYFLNYNTNIFPGEHDANATYSISIDGNTIMEEAKPAEFFFINENYYKTEQISIVTTYTNWDRFSTVSETRRDSNLYFPVTVNYEDPSDPSSGTVTFEVGCGDTTEEYTYTFHPMGSNASLPDQCLSYFTLNHEDEVTVTGGDTIDDGGYYVISDGTSGTITVNTTENVTLRTAGQNDAQTTAVKHGSTSNVCLAAAAGVVPNLRFEGVEMNYSDGPVLNFPNGANIEIVKTENGIHGKSTTANNPAISVGSGTLTITGDSDYYGYSVADSIAIDATTNNASLYLGTGASYVQNGATVMVENYNAISGNAKAAVSAENATVNIQKGDFYVGAAGSNVPAIYANNMQTTYYSKITATSLNNTYALNVGTANMAGSIKLTGKSTTNEAAAYNLTTNQCFTQENYGKKCYKVDTAKLNKEDDDDAYASYFLLWSGDNTNPDNRVYMGAIHELMMSTAGWNANYSGNVATADDKYIYLWFLNADENGTKNYVITGNDKTVGTLWWNAATNAWVVDEPSYTVAVAATAIENPYPEGGTVTLTSAGSGVRVGDTITGTVTVNDGYEISDLRYYYTAANGSVYSSSVFDHYNASTGTFSFTMKGDNYEIEAIFAQAVSADPVVVDLPEAMEDNVTIAGLEDAERPAAGETANVTFTVQSNNACVVLVDGVPVAGTSTGEAGTYSFSAAIGSDSEIQVAYKGDMSGDGDVDVDDASSIINKLRTGASFSAYEKAVCGVSSAAKPTLSSVFDVLNQVYGKTSLAW